MSANIRNTLLCSSPSLYFVGLLVGVSNGSYWSIGSSRVDQRSITDYCEARGFLTPTPLLSSHADMISDFIPHRSLIYIIRITSRSHVATISPSCLGLAKLKCVTDCA
eukprot:scaffold338_cov116-Cylindrotheca_fusiformis.AAC.4